MMVNIDAYRPEDGQVWKCQTRGCSNEIYKEKPGARPGAKATMFCEQEQERTVHELDRVESDDGGIPKPD